MKYKAIIFDFDMTLADSAKVIYELLNVCAEDFGYKKQSFEYVFPVIGNTHEIMLSRVTGINDPDKLLEMREHYRGLCKSRMAEQTVLFDGVPETLREMKASGVKIGLLSLKLKEVLMQILNRYDLSDVFTTVVGCENVSAPKPDPSGLFVAMSELGVNREETMYVGDSLVDEGAAKAAGVDFCAMLRGSTKKEQFDSSFTKGFYTSLQELWLDLNKEEA